MREISFSARYHAAMIECGGRCPIEAGMLGPARRPRVPPRPAAVRPHPRMRLLAAGGRGGDHAAASTVRRRPRGRRAA